MITNLVYVAIGPYVCGIGDTPEKAIERMKRENQGGEKEITSFVLKSFPDRKKLPDFMKQCIAYGDRIYGWDSKLAPRGMP